MEELKCCIELLEKSKAELEQRVDSLKCYAEVRFAECAEKSKAIAQINAEIKDIKCVCEEKINALRSSMEQEITELKANLYVRFYVRKQQISS